MRAIQLFVVPLYFLAATANAICPYPTPKICATYFNSDAVFTGKIISQIYVSDPSQENDNDWIQYKVKVKDIYLGHSNAITNVRTANASARWIGDVGKTYVFFISGGETYSTCGPLDKPEYVQKVNQQINALKQATSSSIEGQVFSRSGPWGAGGGIPVEGEHLKAIGSGKEFETVTDKNGKFVIALPPGNYSLIAPSMAPSDYSNDNLQQIKLKKGQCAQFELLK